VFTTDAMVDNLERYFLHKLEEKKKQG